MFARVRAVRLASRCAVTCPMSLPSSLCVCAVVLSSHDYPQLFAMLWKRVNDVEHIMHVQKVSHGA